MPLANIDARLARANDLIEKLLQTKKLPGLAVGVIQPGELIYSRFEGCADLTDHRPITANTVFRIGSISKTFTAIGLLQLWEQNRFDLDAPVNDYLKTYRVQPPDRNAPPITFRHLLTHTSGLGVIRSIKDAFRVPAAGIAIRKNEPIPPLGKYYAGTLKAEVPPGTKWCYANHGFATLGQLIEDISGEPFADYMRAHVFDPLGMGQTDYVRTDRVSGDLAIGYQKTRRSFKPVMDLEIVVAGAGSIFASFTNMTKYVAWLLSGAQAPASILKPDTLHMMMSPQYQLDSHLTAMGLAFILDQYGGQRVVWHNGGWFGFASMMAIAPDAGLGLLLFSNILASEALTTAGRLMYPLLDVPDPIDELSQNNQPIDRDLAQQLSSYYAPNKGFLTNLQVWGGLGGGLEVSVKNGQPMLSSLIGPARKGVTLHAQADPLVFKYQTGEQVNTIVFKRDAAGQIDRACVDLLVFHRRPRSHNLRFRLKVVAGAVAAVLVIIVVITAIL